MKHIILFLLLCLTATQLSAETLKGKVVDAKTREPIVAANVFFDGTTIGTATGLNGEFSIVVRERIYSKLVISCLGYETVVIAEPFKSLPEVILMDEKEALLDEVEVTAKPVFSRAQKLAAFRKIFLGETVSASQCKILNEDEIKLIYNVEDRTFTAYSDVPLQIVNRHLKYKISWEMVLFKVQFDRAKSLKEQHAERISILGLAAFGDESHNDRTAARRREEVYTFSLKRFFYLLANRTVEASDFILTDGQHSALYYPADSLFSVTTDESEASVKKISIIPRAAIMHEPENESPLELKNVRMEKVREQIRGRIQLMIIRDYTIIDLSRSKLTFSTDSFLVDAYGNTDLVDKLLLHGYLGRIRVGDLLPADYLPATDFEERNNRFIRPDIKQLIYSNEK